MSSGSDSKLSSTGSALSDFHRFRGIWILIVLLSYNVFFIIDIELLFSFAERVKIDFARG